MLEGKNIILRSLEPEDLGFLYECENDTEIWKVSNTTSPFSKNTLKKYIDSVQDIYSDRQLRLIICEKDNLENQIGMVDMYDFDPLNERAGIGIWVSDVSKRREGIATEALELTIDYAFESLHLHQLHCGILENNVPSLNLFEKFGFLHTGTKLQWIKTTSGWENELEFQLMNDRG